MANKSKIRFGIFHKLLIVLVAVTIIPLLVVWYIDYNSTKQRINQYVHERLNQAAAALVARIDDWVEMNYRMLRAHAALPAIQSMDAEKQRPILRLVDDQDDWSYLVFTIAPDGKNIGRSDEQSLKDYADRIYVKQVLDGELMGREVIISQTTGQPAVVLAVPIRGDQEQLKGILAVGVSIAEVSEEIARFRIGDSGNAFLLDERGRVIAHQSEEFTRVMEDFKEHPAFVAAALDGQSSLVYEDERGKKVIAAMQLTQRGLIMVAQQDHDEAFSSLREANREAMIFLAITLIVVVVIAYYVSLRLSRPIRRLTKIANEASVGNFEALNGKIAEVERSDEIGGLARAIERLVASIRVAMSRRRRQKA